jgi:hypothetical protein
MNFPWVVVTLITPLNYSLRLDRMRRRFGSERPQRPPGDEVALKIECVVDGSVHVEEALGRASRLEPLHFTLAASHDLVGILGAIVRP